MKTRNVIVISLISGLAGSLLMFTVLYAVVSKKIQNPHDYNRDEVLPVQ